MEYVKKYFKLFGAGDTCREEAGKMSTRKLQQERAAEDAQ